MIMGTASSIAIFSNNYYTVQVVLQQARKHSSDQRSRRSHRGYQKDSVFYALLTQV